MIKPAALRAALTAALPDLARDPDRLLVFIDAGSVVSTHAEGRSFEYRYTLNLIITDFTGDPDAVMIPLLDWVREHQPELMANWNNHERITFEVDVLANDAVDLSIALPLTERVGVHADADGTTAEHYPEPPMASSTTPPRWPAP